MADAGQPISERNTLRDNVFKQIFRLPALHSLAVFAVIYVGIEVTIGGWIVTFIETKRAAGANAGYISSGFFGGIMIGRIALIWLNRKIGPRRVLFIYLLLAILFVFLPNSFFIKANKHRRVTDWRSQFGLSPLSSKTPLRWHLSEWCVPILFIESPFELTLNFSCEFQSYSCQVAAA